MGEFQGERAADHGAGPAAAEATAPAPVNVTRLIHEAASKSGLLWVRLPDGGTHPVWHVWHDDGDERGTGPAAYVVSGPGEQPLPWLPDEVELILRSKDTGGRLITVHATAARSPPRSRVGRRGRGAAARAAQRGGRHRRAVAAVVHHPPAHPPRSPRRGPGSYARRLGARRRCAGGHGDQRVAALALARPGRRPPQHPRADPARAVPGPGASPR